MIEPPEVFTKAFWASPARVFNALTWFLIGFVVGLLVGIAQ